MAIVTMRQLLESGVHFGHQTRRWNPKMKRFILTERNGIYIIDLQQTIADIDIAFDFVKQTVAHGGTLLFVGTKKQAQEAVAEQAQRVGMPYVNHRWLGGMLTNFSTVATRLQRLKELEQIDFDDVASSGHTKKELLMMRREKDKLSRTLGGIRDMTKVPSAVWIVDPKKEHLAVSEARKLRIPIVAILDTNADPDEVDYRIPGNDDAIRAVALLTRVIADAVAEGLIARSDVRKGKGEEAAAEPLAEWERELLEGRSPQAGLNFLTERNHPMANFTAADVKALREQTGAGMMDVKKALTEADGDAEKALEIIRLKGLKSLSKREGRQASAGLLAAQTDGTVGVLVEVNSETDFVAKNQKFIDFSNEVLAAAVASGAADLDALFAAPMGEGTVKDRLDAFAAIIGEKLQVGRIVRVEGENVDLYLHQTNPDLPPQVGVFVVTDAAGKSVAHDIAMHVAAYMPAYLDRDSVPADVLDKERATLEKITLEEGKPANIVPKIVEGRLNAFYKDNCLVDQAYARDPSKSVGQILKEAGATVTNFVRVHVGA